MVLFMLETNNLEVVERGESAAHGITEDLIKLVLSQEE
jgi:hypothetical protein